MARKANVLRYYKDGQKFYEALNLDALTIAGFGIGTHVAFYMDSIGFSNNYARYDSNDFTRATIPFYNVPSSVGARMQINYSVVPAVPSGSRITPTEADGQWNKTVLLIQGNGTVGSKAIVDAKGRTLYNQTDVVYSDAQHRNSLTSLYFNGTTARLSIEPSRNLDLIDGDFTIEVWLYPTAIQACRILDRMGEIRSAFNLSLAADNTVYFAFQDAATGVTTTIYGPSALTQNIWSFVSVCRYGDDYRVWVNGTGGTIVTTTKFPRRDTDRTDSGDTRTWDIPLVVGANAPAGFPTTLYYKGFMEDLRITNGFARYNNADLHVTPVTAFLPTGSGAEGDPYWADVVLLCHADERVGAVSLREAKGHVLSVVGQTAVGLGQYGGAIVNNGGTTVPFGSEFDFSTGDFTIEAWISDISPGGELWSNTHGPGSSGWQVTFANTANPDSTRNRGTLQWAQWNASGVQDIAISVLYPFYGEQARWHHVCVMRRGNDITVAVDGVGNTTSIVRRPVYSTNNVWITGGPNVSTPVGAFGRHEEIRITRVARYPQNFSVPTAKFPEVAFSYGNATATILHSFLPGEVKAASVVPGAVATMEYSVIQPSIIGKPSVVGADFDQPNAVVPAEATGGEGGTGAVGFGQILNTTQAIERPQTFSVIDEVIAQPVRAMGSALTVTDTAYAMLASVTMTDAMGLSETLPAITQGTGLAEDVELASVFKVAHGAVVAASITLVDVSESAWHEVVTDYLALSAPAHGESHVGVAAADDMTFASDTALAGHSMATSGLSFNAATDNRAIFPGAVDDSVALSATTATDLIMVVSVDEDIDLAELTAPTLLYQIIMQEGFKVNAFFSSPNTTTWAMNVRNAAVSQYSNFNYNSFAKMGERYLGANDQGLFWLDGDLDGARPVSSRIKTGIIQPNGNKLAGVMYAYLGMRGTGEFITTVTDEAGNSYNYTLNAVDMETSRVVFGRGFRTRYFTFTLESQGQDFDLDNVEFVTSDTSRKLQR